MLSWLVLVNVLSWLVDSCGDGCMYYTPHTTHTCRELLQDDDVDPNARGQDQLTALQLAM